MNIASANSNCFHLYQYFVIRNSRQGYFFVLEVHIIFENQCFHILKLRTEKRFSIKLANDFVASVSLRTILQGIIEIIYYDYEDDFLNLCSLYFFFLYSSAQTS